MPKGLSGKLKMDSGKDATLAKQTPPVGGAESGPAGPEIVKPEPAKPAAGKPSSATPAATAVGPSKGEPVKPQSKKGPSWFWWTVAILFALLYAWDLFEALANMFGVSDQLNRLNEFREQNGLNTVAIPWVPLVINVALPIVVYFLSLFVSRKRNVGVLAIVLLCGLGVVAAGSLSLAELVGLLAR